MKIAFVDDKFIIHTTVDREFIKEVIAPKIMGIIIPLAFEQRKIKMIAGKEYTLIEIPFEIAEGTGAFAQLLSEIINTEKRL